MRANREQADELPEINLALHAAYDLSSVAWRRIGYRRSGRLGVLLLAVVVLVALIGPFVAPHPIYETVGRPYAQPSGVAPLGTDLLGRDVLSRFLSGGRLLLLVAFLATATAYAAGMGLGLIAGYRRGAVDLGVVSLLDVVLSIPPIVVALALVAGLGQGVVVVGGAVAAVVTPGITRVVRSVVIEISETVYVEAAVARGERTVSILLREIVPNLRTVVAADFGVRLSWVIILYASLSFLGLSQSPPAADWGLMISENREGILVSLWPVIVPAVAISLLAIGVTLVAESVARSFGRSVVGR